MSFWKRDKDLGAENLRLGSRNQFLPMWKCKEKKCMRTFNAAEPKGWHKTPRCPHCKSKKTERVY